MLSNTVLIKDSKGTIHKWEVYAVDGSRLHIRHPRIFKIIKVSDVYQDEKGNFTTERNIDIPEFNSKDKLTTRGTLQFHVKDNKFAYYRILKDYEEFPFDELMWGNIGREIRIRLMNVKSSKVVFDQQGILETDYDNGYERFVIISGDTVHNLDSALWNNTGVKLRFDFYNFAMEDDKGKCEIIGR